MPVKLLLDECILDKILLQKLRHAGHDVVTTTDLRLSGKADHAVFEAALEEDRMVMTINCADFVDLASSEIVRNSSHPGVLLVYRHNVPSKELSHDDIVRAIRNLEATGLDLKNSCHKLNDYNY